MLLYRQRLTTPFTHSRETEPLASSFSAHDSLSCTKGARMYRSLCCISHCDDQWICLTFTDQRQNPSSCIAILADLRTPSTRCEGRLRRRNLSTSANRRLKEAAGADALERGVSDSPVFRTPLFQLVMAPSPRLCPMYVDVNPGRRWLCVQ